MIIVDMVCGYVGISIGSVCTVEASMGQIILLPETGCFSEKWSVEVTHSLM
jgi:hypothetical protein